MSSDNAVITVFIGILLIIMGIVFLTGRGSFLVAGYNTMSKKKKLNYDSEALCRFIGKFILPIGILTPLNIIDSISNWFGYFYAIIIILSSVFIVYYTNTQERFKN